MYTLASSDVHSRTAKNKKLNPIATLKKGDPMKNLDKVVHDLDKKIDKKMTPIWRFMQKYFVIFSASFLTILMVIFVFRVFSDRTQILTTVIRDDLASIVEILAQIDKECNILDIREAGAVIDFLTVEKFAGSVVGPLNLAHPQHWKGPYLSQNPTIQQKFYEIVRARDGYFIVPGQGASLPNALVMGKDIVIDSNVAVEPMLKEGGSLYYKNQAFAAKLNFRIGDWDTARLDQQTAAEVGKVLQEFNEALPYAQRSGLEEEIKAC